MLRPKIYRVKESSSGEQLIDMIASRLRRFSHNMQIKSNGNVITIITQTDPISIKNYFFPVTKRKEIQELIRAL